jgi:hypothetical protein
VIGLPPPPGERPAPLPVWALQTFWGLAAVLALGVYSLVHTLNYEPPLRVVPPRGFPPQPVVTGNARSLPTSFVDDPMVIHFACNQEDARWARVYDPPASGRSVILRFDQSPDLMRSIYSGDDNQFPKNARVVTTPCTQAMIDNMEFP